MQDLLEKYRIAAAGTDRLSRGTDYLPLLAGGLLGEAGSLITELKKTHREGVAHPSSREWLEEEFGDILWYFVRLCEEVAPDILTIRDSVPKIPDLGDGRLWGVLLLGAECGELLRSIQARNFSDARTHLHHIWDRLNLLIAMSGFSLSQIIDSNIKKVSSRWPNEEIYHPFFDNDHPEYERLPRTLSIEFVDHFMDGRHIVILRCNGINFGDRLSDNSADPDGYRFHDVFHFGCGSSGTTLCMRRDAILAARAA